VEYTHFKIETKRICSIKEIGEEKTFDIINYEKDFYLNEPNFFADSFLVHNSGQHAGGKVLLDKPIYNYIPVERAGKDVVTAFPESGSDAVLDHYKVIKLDLLGITILDVIKSTLEMIVESGEKIFEVQDDAGVTKWVPESYLKREGFL